jgi:hypothetical protein
MLRNLKDIKGYEGLYAITTTGRVWSYRRDREIFPSVDKSASRYYFRIALTDSEGKRRTHYHHVLLATTFIPKHKSDEPLEVNHKDFNSLNNHVKNLEWGTRRENLQHAILKRKRKTSKVKNLKDLDLVSILNHEVLVNKKPYIKVMI